MNEALMESRINKIKLVRQEKQLTQQNIVDELAKRDIHISIYQYKRLEKNEQKNVKKFMTVIEELEKFLNIDLSENNMISKEIHLRIPLSYMNQIDKLKRAKQFSSLTETLLFIINEYFSNVHIFSAKYDLMEDIQSILVNTFVKEMRKMNNELSDYEALLEVATNLSNDEISKLKEKIKQERYKNYHAKFY